MSDAESRKSIALFCREFEEIFKPALELRRKQQEREGKTVLAALTGRYLEIMSIFAAAGESGADGSLIQELNELSFYVNPIRSASSEFAHSTPLGEMMHDAGYKHPEKRAVAG